MTTTPTSSDQIKGSTTTDARPVEVTREPLELYKILKFEGLAESGGRAKAVIAAGQVRVNGKIELQKRKKIVAGDKIEFDGDCIVIYLSTAPEAQQQ